MKPEIGISDKNLELSIDMLSVVLSNEMVLYVKTRKFHWNVSGDSFMECHKLFQTQYIELEETIDLVAERINKLGSKTVGTMKEFIKLAKLKENTHSLHSAEDMMKELLSDHETVVVDLRNDVDICAQHHKDAATVDLLTTILEQHETTAWVLRRYLS